MDRKAMPTPIVKKTSWKQIFAKFMIRKQCLDFVTNF